MACAVRIRGGRVHRLARGCPGGRARGKRSDVPVDGRLVRLDVGSGRSAGHEPGDVRPQSDVGSCAATADRAPGKQRQPRGGAGGHARRLTRPWVSDSCERAPGAACSPEPDDHVEWSRIRASRQSGTCTGFRRGHPRGGCAGRRPDRAAGPGRRDRTASGARCAEGAGGRQRRRIRGAASADSRTRSESLREPVPRSPRRCGRDGRSADPGAGVGGSPRRSCSTRAAASGR